MITRSGLHAMQRTKEQVKQTMKLLPLMDRNKKSAEQLH